jgi:hypothetical protein
MIPSCSKPFSGALLSLAILLVSAGRVELAGSKAAGFRGLGAGLQWFINPTGALEFVATGRSAGSSGVLQALTGFRFLL